MTAGEATSGGEAGEPCAASPRRIVVAMSGGVDSSVAAALLQRDGYEVVGITLQLYDQGAASGKAGSCCAGQDILDARRVARHLGIPHYVLDYEQRFRSAVIDSFAASYIGGETPVPCVICNQKIKFADLLDAATGLGAEALATGHYVVQRDGPAGPELHAAADASRDQSYFLFSTTRAQLARLRFPLGGLAKTEIRRLARELALPVADKPDSQDICFVPSGRYASVIERLRPDAAAAGDIVDTGGRVLGRHAGIVNFTVGQRRGLGLAGDGEPYFVVRLDAERRRVVVGRKADLLTRRVVLRDVNWLGDGPLAEAVAGGLGVHVRLRSSQPPRPGRLVLDGGSLSVELGEGEYGISPGQAAVFYADGAQGSRVLGGGWIARAPSVTVGDEVRHSGAAVPPYRPSSDSAVVGSASRGASEEA